MRLNTRFSTRLAASLLVACTAMLATAAIAVASPSTPASIVVPTVLGQSTNPFTATGGIICSSGIVSDISTNFVGYQSQTHAQILIVKEFVCSDGTFDLLLRVKLDFATQNTTATWSVLRGDGAFAALHGTGTLSGQGRGTSVLDTYTGSFHIA